MSSTKSRRRPTSQAFLFASRPESPDVDADVLGEDAAGTLDFLIEQRRRQDVAAAHELRAVLHWADLHPADGVGAAHPEVHAHLAGGPLLGAEGELRLAGEAAFTVAEFAITELAAALGMSEPAARAYAGQALELRGRLPRLLDRVLNGELPAWKARQIAAETIPLNAAAAAYVDTHLAPYAAKLSLRRILRAVHAAILHHDPALAADRAAKAADRRGVWLGEDDLDGTTAINSVTDTPIAHAFDAALNDAAATLKALGDPDSLDARRAKALGVLADPQYALDLAAHAQAGGQAAPRPRSGGPTMHVHLHTDAVDGIGSVTRIEGYGPRNLGTVEQWLQDLAPGASIKVTPVVDLNDHIAVDAYEIPDRLRIHISERDLGCRFPWCGRTGRFDLDHIDPYDEHGPPGQTSTSNLARLCRFHHRVKTHGNWSYRRRGPTALEWTSPLGRIYTVDHTGTRGGA